MKQIDLNFDKISDFLTPAANSPVWHSRILPDNGRKMGPLFHANVHSQFLYIRSSYLWI
ncbi:MAG: hypothetical protein R3F19_06305 [Verrucomicrobiales bacterium]